MEVKINQEIRGVTEHLFFGLTMGQMISSALALAAGAAVFLLLHGRIGTEWASWCSVLSAAVPASFGFVKAGGMRLDRYLKALVRFHVRPRQLLFLQENLFYEQMTPWFEKTQKEMRKKDGAYKKDTGEEEGKNAGHDSGEGGVA